MRTFRNGLAFCLRRVIGAQNDDLLNSWYLPGAFQKIPFGLARPGPVFCQPVCLSAIGGAGIVGCNRCLQRLPSQVLDCSVQWEKFEKTFSEPCSALIRRGSVPLICSGFRTATYPRTALQRFEIVRQVSL